MIKTTNLTKESVLRYVHSAEALDILLTTLRCNDDDNTIPVLLDYEIVDIDDDLVITLAMGDNTDTFKIIGANSNVYVRRLSRYIEMYQRGTKNIDSVIRIASAAYARLNDVIYDYIRNL